MRRYGIDWHRVEREWTYAQLRYLFRGIRLNQAAEHRAMERGPEGVSGNAGGAAGRPLTAEESAALGQFLPASMVAEAVYKE